MNELVYQIDRVQTSEHHAILDLWEASVRATHHFLKDDDIEFFKPLILNKYLVTADIRCVRDMNQKIIGFLGVEKQNIDMLFIHPDSRGNGVGKFLMKYAIKQKNAHKVDVNEENKQAVGFYEKLGFKTVSRSKLDSTGKPYPILHMELS